VERPFAVNIAGYSYDNDDGSSRQEILSRCQVGESLILTHVKNPYDKNAIKVARMNGEQIGFLHKSTAKIIAPLVDRDGDMDARIVSLNSSEREHGGLMYECKIAFNNPEVVSELKKYYDGSGAKLNSGGKQAMPLTDEEKQRIAEEEKERMKARNNVRSKNLLIGCGIIILLGIILGIIIIISTK